jgi:hypothetical protein
MVRKADDIVIATGLSASTGHDARGRIVTRFTLRVDESLKGSLAARAEFVLTEPGGVLPEGGRIMFGAPRYEAGGRYLVFTSTNRDSERATFGMALGKFDLTNGVALRHDIDGFDQNLEAYIEPARDASRFMRFIRDIVALRPSSPDYLTSSPAALSAADSAEVSVSAASSRFTRSSYVMQTFGGGMRWLNPSADWVSSGTQPGADGQAATAKAIAQWNGTASTIRYRYAGVDNTAVGGTDFDDGKNAVLFNDPNDEIPDDTPIVGISWSVLGGAYDLDGERFRNILGGDVVIAHVVNEKYQMSQACLNNVVSHELGHTLGLRHANQPTLPWVCDTTADCAAGAIMAFGGGDCDKQDGVLSDWDRDAAATVYGNGACTLPDIVGQPQSSTVGSGAAVILFVRVNSGRTLHYAWYEGPRGDTSRPVGQDYHILLPVPYVERSTSYWVRVSDVCGSSDSAPAVITVPVRHRAARH